MSMLNAIFPTRKTPLIPGRHQKEVISTNFSGTEFSIALPPTSSGFASVTDDHCDGVDIDNINTFNNQGRYDFESGLPWIKSFLRREPTIFSGLFGRNRIGGLTVAGNAWYFSDLPDHMSLFNPAHCERAIRRLNYFYSGPGSLIGKKYIQPLNWKIIERCGIDWVYYESLDFNEAAWRAHHPNESLPAHASYCSCHYNVPIGDRVLLTLVMSFLGYEPVSHALQVLHGLREECFSTVELKYSEATRSKIKEVREKWPQAKYSLQREPENWMWHDFYDEDTYQIREHGSPVPSWES